MAGINKAILVGRLGKDPEVRTLNSDRKVANLSVATSKKIKGEEKTEWHRITVWSETTIKYLKDFAKKGSVVYIEGEIETRKYEKEGRDVYTTEIVVGQYGGNVQILSDFKDKGDSKSKADEQQSSDYDRDPDDEIPF